VYHTVYRSVAQRSRSSEDVGSGQKSNRCLKDNFVNGTSK